MSNIIYKKNYSNTTMKKSKIACGLLALGLSVGAVQAHENEGGNSSLNYSVFASYKDYKSVNANKAYATQQYAQTMLPGWSASVDKLTGSFKDMFGPAAAVDGGDNMQKAQRFITNQLVNLGVVKNEWQVTRNITAPHAAFVSFKRVVDGHEVVFSNLDFRFTTDGRLQRIKMSDYGTIATDMLPQISAATVLNGSAITKDMGGVNISTKEVNPDWVWFPIPTPKGYVVHPAWAFSMTGVGAMEMPFEISGYVDAITGELLYRSNAVNETFEVTVKGDIHLSTPVAPTSEVPIADMRVTVSGNNYVTDANGDISVATANAPQTVDIAVRGPWSNVREGGSTVTFNNVNIATSPSIYKLPISDTTTKEFRAVSVFYHVNKIHDFMKLYWPTFSGMDNTLATNIDITSNQQCNAFYQNGQYSINFYPPQSSCRAFSIVSDIVYHEYGHGISYRFYSDQGSVFRNGALGEGNSDVWAMCINRDGVVGDGAYINGGNIRSYTGAPKVYPFDIRGQVHADGEIIAGAWWDVAKNTTIDTMAKLFTLTHYDLPNGPSGTEGDVYYDILISALMNDDDDANLANKTPHFTEIVEAFARHGIYLLYDAEFEHTELNHQQPNAAVTFSGNLKLTNPVFFDKIYLHYRNRYSGTGWDSVAMTNTTGTTYTVQVPGFPGGAIVDYYFKTDDIAQAGKQTLPLGYTPYYDASKLTLPYQFGVGLYIERYKNDFETDITGWELTTTGDNTALNSGAWVNDVPVGTSTNGLDVQPGYDHTSGTGKCLVTGNTSINDVSFNDVDNGKQTILTPYFNLPFNEPVVEYYRWYSNNRGSNSNARTDSWEVSMRNQGSMFWTTVDGTDAADQKWRRRIFRVSEFLPGATSVQLRFVAEDAVRSTLSNNGQDVVEAAIDDFIIYDGTPLNVDNVTVKKAQVYPNPADKEINVIVPAESKGSITMYDFAGRVVLQQEVSAGNTDYKLNTSAVATGSYMILVQTQFAVQNSTVIVKHD